MAAKTAGAAEAVKSFSFLFLSIIIINETELLTPDDERAVHYKRNETVVSEIP